MREPSPRRMKSGSPPTERNARTGLLTPPGRRCIAPSMSLAERSIASVALASMLSPLPCNRFHPFGSSVPVLYLHYRTKPVITHTPGDRPDQQRPENSLLDTGQARLCVKSASLCEKLLKGDGSQA